MSVQTTKKAIAVAMITNRGDIISLLNKHGVNISNNYTDHEVIVAVLKAMKESTRFRTDLANLLNRVASEHTMHFTPENVAFVGENMFKFSGLHYPPQWASADGNGNNYLSEDGFSNPLYDDYNNASAGSSSSSGSSSSTSTSSPKKDSVLSGLFTGQNLSNLFNTGLGVLSTSLTNKSNKELAQTALEIEQEKTKQAALIAAGGGSAGGVKSGMSTGAKIGIAVAIIAGAGLLTWGVVALVKKHKRTRAAKS